MIDFTKNTLFSIEVFPPKDSVGLNEIYASMGRFQALRPDYISVTYGAGGTGSGKTLEIASDIRNKFGVESIAHLTCAGLSREQVDAALNNLETVGVENILALRGDLRDGMRTLDFTYASDLIAYINQRGGFRVCAACYPEGHLESRDFSQDIEVAKRKQDLGVTHFISQLFFDNAAFYRMRDAMAAAGICVPVQAGIMPITSAKQILRIIGLCGASLPPRLTKLVGRFERNPAAMAAAGISYAVEQIADLAAEGVAGIHLYSMNNPAVAERIHSSVAPILAEVNRADQ